MKALEVSQFELGYQSRRWWTWLYVVAFLAVSFAISAEGLAESAQAQGFWINSPYSVATITLVGSAMGLLIAAAFAGDAGARDAETRMAALVYTSPLTEHSYLAGRFIAAFLLNALILITVQVAFLGSLLISDAPAELLGPITISHNLTAYLLIALPNAFLGTALLFALSVLTRRAVASYLGAVILFFISLLVWLVIAQMLGQWEVAKIVDPLGVAVFREVAQSTTAAQKNVLSISSDALLLNRAVWLTVGAVIIALTHLRFRFQTRDARTWRQRRSELEAAIPERAIPISVPKVQKSKMLATRISQFLVIAMQSFREVAISWGGLVLMILALTIVAFGPQALNHLGVPQLPTTEQMVSWVGHPGEVLWFIVPILTAFFAGELVWRDRETRLSEIADAAPVPESIQFAGRFAGLALLLIGYQVMLVLACVIVQLQMGYTDIEPLLYLKVVLGMSLVEHLLFAAVAFALHVVINQKYVGYLAVIGVYAFIQSAASIGITHHLIVYGTSPEWTYSDMAGFGTSLIAWSWFKTYWAAWAVLLCTIAILFWVRGREAGFKGRLALVRERLTPRVMGIAAAMIAVIIGTGGFIFYHTNVLNANDLPNARVERSARYEKTYAKFASIPQPDLAGISLRVDIFPQSREARLHGTYALVNRTKSPVTAVHFLPQYKVETSDATFDRPARLSIDDKALSYRVYELAAPLKPGDSIHVGFDVHFHRTFGNNGLDPSLVGNGSYFEGEWWLPAIGYQRDRELSARGDRMAHGLGRRAEVPALDDSAARNTNHARRIAFDAVVSTDDDQTAVAPGALKKTWSENGRRYFHYVADAPIRNDFAIYSAHYAVKTAKWNDVTIQVMYHPEHTHNVDATIASAQASLDYFTKNLGSYPYHELRLVEHPGDDVTLHASPINISYEEGFSGLNSEADPRGFNFPYAVVAHEISHQWWGNQLSPADVEGGPLLTESLAWYSAMCIVAASRGEDQLQRLLDLMHGGQWTISSRASVPLLQVYSRFAAYRKGPFAVYALREYLGEQQVNVALRKLLDKYKTGEPPLPTSRDLYAELKAVAPDSLQGFLGDLFERNAWWEVETKAVSAVPAGQGKWRVDLDVLARKVTVDKEGAETEVAMNDPVEIGVYGAGGTATRGVELYRGMHRIKTGAQRITVMVDAKPVRAGIDPRNLLIDADPVDNIKNVGG